MECNFQTFKIMTQILIVLSIVAIIMIISNYIKKRKGNDKDFVSQYNDHIKDQWKGNHKDFVPQYDDHIKDHWSVNKVFIGKGFVNKRVSSEDKRIGGSLSYPKCGLESQNQHWFEFRTDDKSWMSLAGSSGFYSRCPDCEIIVNDITIMMS